MRESFLPAGERDFTMTKGRGIQGVFVCLLFLLAHQSEKWISGKLERSHRGRINGCDFQISHTCHTLVDGTRRKWLKRRDGRRVV